MSEHAEMQIGTIKLEWTDWRPWRTIPSDELAAIPQEPGVYEVSRENQLDGDRLQIGRATRLRTQVA